MIIITRVVACTIIVNPGRQIYESPIHQWIQTLTASDKPAADGKQVIDILQVDSFISLDDIWSNLGFALFDCRVSFRARWNISLSKAQLLSQPQLPCLVPSRIDLSYPIAAASCTGVYARHTALRRFRETRTAEPRRNDASEHDRLWKFISMSQAMPNCRYCWNSTYTGCRLYDCYKSLLM